MSIASRRALFASLLSSAGLAASEPADKALPAPEQTSLLLSRITFGPRQEDFDAVQRFGLNAYLEAQLNYTSIDDSAIENALEANFSTLRMSNLELLTLARSSQQAQFQALGELRAATMLRQIYSPRQLFEVMVEFWNNHFSVEHTDGPIQSYKTTDDAAIRRNAMGRFRDLLRENARSPAMLYYLDNYASTRLGPNENYSRELLELHTLGVNGGYTENDVKEVARILTGWTIDRRNGDFTFLQAIHDFGPKLVMGLPYPANRGIEEGQELLDFLASHPSTASFIATKLVRRFVADSPPAALVRQVADVFLQTDGDIRAMLRTIFTSSEFAASADQKVKRPAEFIQSALRATNAQLTGTTYFRALNDRLNNMGQLPFMWPAPNGYPDVQNYWINTTAWLNRWNFSFALLEGRIDRGIRIDLNALMGNASTAAQVVDNLTARLLRRPLTAEDRNTLLALAGNSSARLSPEERLARGREVAAVLLSSNYFHFR